MRKKLFSFITALFCIGSMMTVQAADYYLAGTMNGWNTTNSANKMSLVSGTIYSKTISAMSATTYQFKISTYNWASGDWGSGSIDNTQSNVTLSGNGNISFTLSTTSDVTFYFDAGSTKKIYVQATPVVVPSYTFPAGTTIYYDFTAYGSGVNLYNSVWNNEWKSDVSSIISITLSSAWEVTASSNLFKSAASGWNPVTCSTLPEDGQNMLVSTDGVNFTWGTYAASPDPDPQPVSHTYTVAGSSNVAFVNTWAPDYAANDMTEDNGIYTWEKSNLELAAGSIEFKVCEDHAWTISYPASNYVLNIPAAGIYTITITFNGSSHAVAAEATKTGDAVVIPTVAMHGNFTGSWQDTELFTKDIPNGICTLEMNNLAAGNYTFGMRIGGSGNWTSNGVAFSRDNQSAEVVSGSGDLTLAADIPGKYTFTWTYETNVLTIGFPNRVDYVKGLIDDIPDPVTVTDACADAIEAARNAYDALSGEEQVLVTNYSVLTDAEEAYAAAINQAWVDEVIDAINAIPNPVVYTDACYALILNARNEYNALPEALRADVTNYSVLTDAEAAYNALIRYTVAGMPSALFGTEWDPENTANDMTLQPNGTYLWEKEGAELAEGSVAFKVCKDHAWTISYPNSDYVLPIPEDGIYTITITFNPAAEGNKVSGVATKTGDAVIAHTAQMKGIWDEWANAVDYVNNGDGTATVSKRFAATGDYTFKVIIDGGWRGESNAFTRNNNEIEGIVDNTGDMKLTVDVPGCYTFTWNFESNKLTVAYPSLTIDVAAIVNNQTGTIVLPAEQIQGTELHFGVAPDGSRVAADDPTAVLFVDGHYHSEHGMVTPTFTVMVPGSVDIYVGKCTYSTKTINVRNANNELVVSKTPTAACWKNDHANMTVLHYEGVATTLTISGMDFCPYIRVKTAPALDPLPEYINVKAQVNNQTGTDLTNDEMAAQGNAVSFGMNAANERVAVDAANAILQVNGNYHSDHGMTNAVFTVRVPGNVDIYVGECTYSSKTINVKDEDNNLVASLTPEAVCWKNDHNNLAVLHYVGEANTLTISGMDYCPYICVKSTPVPVPSEIDIPAIVNNQEGTLLENSELVQNTPVNFGVAADGSRVPADHPNAILYVDGKYHSEHGLKNPIFTVRVPGEVEIYVGECTYSTATIEVRDANNTLVDSKTPEAVCWKNDPDNLAVLHYTGEATTLTISGMQYCPFIRVKTPTVPVYTEVRSGLEINRYYTICLPQAFTEAQGASFWTLRYRNNSSTEVYLEEETAPFEAGKPYIFQATAETLEVMYEGEPVSTPVENGALRGTLVDLSESELAAKGTNIYLLIQNALRPITSGNYLNANRAYIDFDALQAVSTAPAAAPGRRVRNMPMQGQVATGVDALNVSDQPTKMVIDGQLIIRRGEKLYDATGRVVK